MDAVEASVLNFWIFQKVICRESGEQGGEICWEIQRPPV